jgi:hypothetical protein
MVPHWWNYVGVGIGFGVIALSLAKGRTKSWLWHMTPIVGAIAVGLSTMPPDRHQGIWQPELFPVAAILAIFIPRHMRSEVPAVPMNSNRNAHI